MRRLGVDFSVAWVLWLSLAAVLFWLAPPNPLGPIHRFDGAIFQRRLAMFEKQTSSRMASSLEPSKARGHLAILVTGVGYDVALFDALLATPTPLSFSLVQGALYAPGVQARIAIAPASEKLRHELWLQPSEDTTTKNGAFYDHQTVARFTMFAARASESFPVACGIFLDKLFEPLWPLIQTKPALGCGGPWLLLSTQLGNEQEAIMRGANLLRERAIVELLPREKLSARWEFALALSQTTPTIFIAPASYELVALLDQAGTQLEVGGILTYTVSELFRRQENAGARDHRSFTP